MVRQGRDVLLTEEEWNEIQDDLDKLYRLEAAGVDNWEWYDEAMCAGDDD